VLGGCGDGSCRARRSSTEILLNYFWWIKAIGRCNREGGALGWRPDASPNQFNQLNQSKYFIAFKELIALLHGRPHNPADLKG
jgi:hypothetical protein